MRKNIILICVLAFISLSCEQEVNNEKINESLELNKNFSFERLANSPIGIEKNGKIELGVPDEKIMETFKEYAKMHSPDINPKSFEIINLDNAFYLRFYSDKNIVSTIALLKDESNQYMTGGTVCETVACASGGGCVPQGAYCTECRPNGPDNPKGDCKRTTTKEF